jgi:hypothetical protein
MAYLSAESFRSNQCIGKIIAYFEMHPSLRASAVLHIRLCRPKSRCLSSPQRHRVTERGPSKLTTHNSTLLVRAQQINDCSTRASKAQFISICMRYLSRITIWAVAYTYEQKCDQEKISTGILRVK